jgi:hypothetical protein
MRINTKRWVRVQLNRSAFHQSDARTHITEEQTAVFTVGEITDVMEAIARSTGDLFQVRIHRHGPYVVNDRIGRAFLRCLGMDLQCVRKNFPNHRFSPLFELFEQMWKSGLRRDDLAPQTVGHFNAVIDGLRSDAHAHGVLDQLAKIDRMVRDNSKSLLGHLDKLFAGRARNLVIRVDLNYQGETADGTPGTPRAVTASMVRRHLQALLGHIRRRYPSYRTYVWSIESALIRGVHIHLCLILDGNLARKDVAIGRNICEEWKRISGGNAFNCNDRKDFYASRGILSLGLVHRDNTIKRENLERTILYFAKRDFYLRLEMPGLRRTLGKGLLRSRTKIIPTIRRKWRKVPPHSGPKTFWGDRATRHDELFDLFL